MKGVAKPSDYPSMATATDTVARTTDDQVAALRKLDKPGGNDGKAIDAFLGDLAAVSAPARTAKDKANAKDLASGPAVADMQAKAKTAASSAGALSLKECGTAQVQAAGTIVSGSEPVLKKEVIAKGDALCATAFGKFKKLGNPTSTPAGLQRYADSFKALQDELVAGLRALPAPPGDEAALAGIVASLEKRAPALQEETTAAKRGDVAATQAKEKEFDAIVDEGSAKVDAFGFKNC